MDDLGELLALQHGIITNAQARQHGVTYSSIKQRVKKGTWQRIHHGVYATFSGELARTSRLWAAVLRTGAGALLSHDTAAELHGLADRPSSTIHVTIPADRRTTAVPGISVHVSVRAEKSCHPVLLPPRTRVEDTVLDLVDAAPSLDRALGWITRACGRRLTTAQRLLAALRGRSRIRWRRELEQGLSDVREGAHSIIELRYIRKVERSHGLPRGRRQSPATPGNRKQWDDVDYSECATIVELDGRIGHSEEGVWRDMDRDNHRIVDGRVVLRYGYADATARPCDVALQVATVLQQRGWRGRPRPCGPQCIIPKD